MKKFLVELSVFIAILFISFYLVFIQADGYTDPFYIRFTTKKQNSMILGTSRAAQGIHPAILNEVLDRTDLFNYSFTITSSPYGPAYFKSIKRKLDPHERNGIFILAVDPWSISSNSRDPNDSINFKEAGKFMGKISFVNLNPNIQYLLNSYNQPLYNLLLHDQQILLVHEDGWLEVSVELDSAKFNKNLDKKVEDYRLNNLPVFHFSQVRYDYLIKTIEYLKLHGKVYLVRLPVHPRMMEVDEELLPDFDKKIKHISENTNTPYLDMAYLNEQTLFIDGNHIYKKSGEEISREIGKWILSLN